MFSSPSEILMYRQRLFIINRLVGNVREFSRGAPADFERRVFVSAGNIKKGFSGALPWGRRPSSSGCRCLPSGRDARDRFSAGAEESPRFAKPRVVRAQRSFGGGSRSSRRSFWRVDVKQVHGHSSTLSREKRTTGRAIRRAQEIKSHREFVQFSSKGAVSLRLPSLKGRPVMAENARLPSPRLCGGRAQGVGGRGVVTSASISDRSRRLTPQTLPLPPQSWGEERQGRTHCLKFF